MIVDPVYGELLSSREVSLSTGFTMNQLRNWRLVSRHELAPFGHVRIGGTSYYRKVVVQDWIAEHGNQRGVYVQTERDKKFPIGEVNV